MIKRTEGKPTEKDREMFRRIMFMDDGKPRCHYCGKAMIQVRDKTCGKFTGHNWKCNCKDFPKHLVIGTLG
jgi:hypothetical protein